jgi:hypothetical protein
MNLVKFVINMKTILLYTIFLICSQSYCQEKDSIRYISFPEKSKKFIVNKLTIKDTIYMLFKQKKNQRKYSTKKNDKIISFSYNYDFKKGNVLYFSTGRKDSITSDYVFGNKKAGVKWVDRKFLRKNRDRVFTYKKIEKNGFEKTVEEVENCIFYLIDIEMKEDGKYIAREVGALFPIEM